MRNDRQNLIVEMSFMYALDIIEYAELLESKKKSVIANQVLKSGTSIGANVREAQNAESKADFVHKIKIAAKEADETMFWLELCMMAKNYPNCQPLLDKANDIMRVLSKIISTSKKK